MQLNLQCKVRLCNVAANQTIPYQMCVCDILELIHAFPIVISAPLSNSDVSYEVAAS